MRKIFGWTFVIFSLSTVLLFAQAFESSEDTAQLTFSKTAVSRKNVHAYTVQKGDVLSAIIRRLPGITEKDIPVYYLITKELNPGVSDLNRLYTGQTIVLPGQATTDSLTADQETESASQTLSLGTSVTQAYRVKRGDSLIRIIHRELHVTSKTQKTLLLIKSLNPNIKDPDKIYIDQIIRLPESATNAETNSFSSIREKQPLPSVSESFTTEISKAESVPMFSKQETPTSEEKESIDAKDSVVMTPAARLAVIKHIIMQMNGSMNTSGNYYLPISKTEQLTIDCALIPVVELDDRTIIFLDLENRSNDHLKKMITDHWSNYHLVKINDKDDIIVILKKIFLNTRSYEIIKAQKPISVSSLPSLEIIVDWIITGKGSKMASSKIQGLRFVYENNTPLPRAVVNTARQHSFIITEISPAQGLVAKSEEIYSLPTMTTFPTSSAKDFSLALLSYLNIPTQKDVDVRVFNIADDGFNLSIKADIIVTQGEKKTIIFSRNLPMQFVSILEKSGNKLIFLSDQDEPTQTMEKILRSFHFVFTTGYFSFSGLDKNQPPYQLGFKGTKIKTDRDIYVVHFDFNQELRGLLQEAWSANIVQYY